MKTSGQCPKCGSKELIADAMAFSNTDMSGLSVSTFKKPNARVLKDRRSSPLSTCVCGECGYVEFYAAKPNVLRGK